jgi:hypothetical protein
VKSVGDLRGLWSPLPNACGIGFGSVPGNNRDVGMGLEPRGHGFSRSIFKHVNGATPLKIDNDGAVAITFTPRPVVDSNDFRFRALRQTQAAHTSKEGIATPWETVARQVPSSGSAAEDQPCVGLRGGQSRCRARIKRRHCRESFGKGLSTTRAGTTAEAAND